jgi:hypothetical protein
VIPDFIQPFAGTNISPFTAFIREGKNFFEPAPSLIRPDIVHGLLNLQLTQGPAAAARPVFQAIHLDVDGAGLKLLNTVAHETGSQSGPVEQVVEGEPAPPLTPNDPAEVGGVSSLRTSGVTIARSGHGELLGQRIQTSKTNNDRIEAGDLPTLFAEDLVRGYRCDVFDIQTGVWRSLHRRIGTYTFKADDGPAPLTIIDEGAVQPALTRPIGADGVKPDDDAELYIHESLAHWQGWSLAAPRPGLTVTDNGPAAVTSQAPANGVPLEVTFEAEPGTLPRLRFGRRYRFRARTVDLAGNGLDVDEATTLHDEVIQNELHQPRPILPGDRELPLAYHRFEPVISPVLVPRQRFNEGESLEHLVIRSRTDADTAGEAVALTAMSAGASYSATCERHVVPPKTSQSMAEMSGLLDASFGTHTAFDLTYEIARREKGRLTDPDDPNSPNVETVASGSAESPYVVHHEAQLTVPYLPDPFSAGAALFGLPHQTLPAAVDSSGGLAFGPSTLPPGTLNELGGSSVHISFGDRWPERVPFRLVLTEAGNDAAPAAPTWDPTTRELTVFLAKAEQVTFQLASFMKDTDLGQMGIWQWLAEEKVPGIGEIQTAVEGGRWQLTPARTISLVHAVEQPLVAPQLESLDTPRDPGDTVAYIAARIPVHGQSTSKIDLMASWSEDVDPPGSPRQQLNAHVFAVPIHLPGDGPPDPGDLLIPPGVVPVVPIAAYDPSADVLHLQGNFPRQGLNVLSRQHFGDTKHRTVDYQASATTRFGEYFPAQIFNDADRLTVAGAPATSVIRSSARPAAPKVVSVLPTFRWSRPVQANGVRASARSSGIRVYMERPWFSSGDGELLGIILTDEANFPPDDTLAPFVSHWAQDPIFGTEPLRMQLPTGESIGVPRAELPPGHNNGSFPKATATASSLTLQELSAAIPATDNPSGPDRVDVAGHVVEYDAFRNLLYCDIDIDTPTGTYFPFVRLALARYQPNSLAGLELSRVVVADFVQVPPSRIATLSLDPNDPNAFDVELSGTTYTSNAWTPFFSGKIGVSNPASDIPPPALVTVTVEERIPNTSDDVGWVPADPLKFSVEVTTAVQAGGTAINNEQLVADVIPTTLWTGKVRVPADRSPEQVRIVVREHEHLNTDTVVSKSVVLSDPNQQNFQAAQFPTQRLVVAPGEGRLVFAETFVL